MSPWQIIAGLCTVIATLAGTLWGFSLKTISDLKKEVADKDNALNACRNAQIVELKANLSDASKNLNASTAATQAATTTIEATSETLDQTLALVRKQSTDLDMVKASIERLERQTESCLKRVP